MWETALLFCRKYGENESRSILPYNTFLVWNLFWLDPGDGHTISLETIVLQVAKLGLVVGSMAVVWQGRTHDLVEKRLRFRSVFVVSIGVLVSLVVVAELVSNWRVPVAIELLGMVTIFALALTINLAFLRLDPAFSLMRAHSSPLDVAKDEDPLIKALSRLMKEDRLYADHDLRVADVAAQLKIPQHQLRRTINQALGHRNFNQFINRYRIDEAGQRLINEPRTPVLTIALDVGFRSISSFNAAFRAHHKCSPTAYRSGLR